MHKILAICNRYLLTTSCFDLAICFATIHILLSIFTLQLTHKCFSHLYLSQCNTFPYISSCLLVLFMLFTASALCHTLFCSLQWLQPPLHSITTSHSASVDGGPFIHTHTCSAAFNFTKFIYILSFHLPYFYYLLSLDRVRTIPNKAPNTQYPTILAYPNANTQYQYQYRCVMKHYIECKSKTVQVNILCILESRVLSRI